MTYMKKISLLVAMMYSTSGLADVLIADQDPLGNLANVYIGLGVDNFNQPINGTATGSIMIGSTNDTLGGTCSYGGYGGDQCRSATDAIGLGNYTSIASGSIGGIAIGTRAEVGNVTNSYLTDTPAFHSIAIGDNTHTYGNNSISFGSQSTDDGRSYVLSLGNASLGIKRTITNVADGALFSGSTEAVTGSQLYATNQTVNAISGQITNAYNLANSANNTANSALMYAGDALIIANDAQTLATQVNNRTFGINNELRGSQSVLNISNPAGGRQITGVIAGTQWNDAVNLSQLQQGLQSSEMNAYYNSINIVNDALHGTGVDGARADIGISTATGTDPDFDVLETTASLTVTNSLGNTHGIIVSPAKTEISGGTTSTSLTLDDSGATLATVATGAPAQLHGVADGTAPNDAVNVKQLTDALASFTGGGGVGSSEIKRLDGRIDRLEGKIKEIAKKAYGGTALSMALAAPTPVQAGQVQMGFGIGNFNGESALALNVSRATETGNAVVSFGGGFTSAGDIGFRGAIAWAWDPEVSTK